jgi:hypothetical protein
MPGRKVFRDYDEQDVNTIYAQAEPSGWYDLVGYLEKRGKAGGPRNPGEDAHLIADAKQVLKDNAPFSHNPEQAYRILRSHRNPELVRQEEQKWIGVASTLECGQSTARQSNI